MKSNSVLYKILNLKEGEGSLVLLPVIYSFFAGASLAFFVTSSTSLFLNIFERDMLSIAFIASGVIVWLVGQGFSKIQKHFNFTKSITGGLGFLLISVILFTGFYIGYNSLVIIFLIYAWIRVFAYIHAVTFWGVAGRLFSLRQGKRLFGLISGGEVIASIVSFMSVPFLLNFLTTEDLLFISGANLLIGFFFMLLIIRKFKNNLSIPVKKKQVTKSQTKKTSFLENRYYKLFFVIAFIPIFAQFFVDFIFQAQAKIEYPDKEALTAFVGVFFGISSIVEFILKTFISGRLLSKYGMKFGLIAFPAVLAISFILASTFGLIYGAASLFFSFVALGRLFTRAIRTSFNDPATQILYQPLPPEERISFQNRVESGPKAYASIVAGLILFGLAGIPGFSLVYFAVFLLAIIALWYKSAIELFKEYRKVLQKILEKKDNGQEKKTSAYADLISSAFKDENRKKSLYRFFRLIFPYLTDKIAGEENIPAELSPNKTLKFSEIIEFSKSDEAIKRIVASINMTRYTIYKIEKPISRLLHDEEFLVKSEAIIATGKIKERDLFYHLIDLFQKPMFTDISSSAMVNIGQPIISELDHNFQKTEYDTKLQLSTVELINRIGGNEAIKFLSKNIKHHNKLVSDRVIKALGDLGYKADRTEESTVWQKIENEIKNYVFLASSLINLEDDNAESLLYKALVNEKEIKKQRIYSNLSILYDSHALKLIQENLNSGNKNSIGFALEVADTIISELHKPLLQPFFESIENEEVVEKFAPFFEQEKSDASVQIVDIINSEYWVTGYYTKCCAIKTLFELSGYQTDKILIANLVHPNKMIWQIASYILYNRNKELFFKEVNQNFPKVPGLLEFSEKIEKYVSGEYTLIHEKLLQLKNIELFNDIYEEELIELAESFEIIKLSKGQSLILDINKTEVFLVYSGEANYSSNNIKLSKSDIIIPITSQEDKLTITPDIEEVSIIKFELHFCTHLFSKNLAFAERLIEKIK